MRAEEEEEEEEPWHASVYDMQPRVNRLPELQSFPLAELDISLEDALKVLISSFSFHPVRLPEGEERRRRKKRECKHLKKHLTISSFFKQRRDKKNNC